MCDVEIVLHGTTLNFKVWKIRRTSPDAGSFLGWACEDGSFTAGLDPTIEILDAVMFRTSGYATAWALEHGWNVVEPVRL